MRPSTVTALFTRLTLRTESGANQMPRLTVFFGLYVAGVVAITAGALRALFGFTWDNPTASHAVGIPFVALVLVFTNRQSIFSTVRPSPWLGGAVAIVGLALATAAHRVVADAAVALSIATAGIALSWIGGFLLFYGVAAARQALFPLAFLVFMVPMPGLVIDGATRFLKEGSTEAVASLFTVTGTPYFRQGFVFALPDVVIEIADECSGIRSSIALLLTSLLAGHTLLRSSWTKIALVLVVLPIAVLKNAIRIVALSLLAIHVDPSFLTGQLHHEGGIVFFLLALGLLAPVFLFLRRFETPRVEHVQAS
jgi:exosortase